MAAAGTIDALRRRLNDAPEDLRLAGEYWVALGDVNGTDVRSGRSVVEAFGRVALVSDAGALALAKAYDQLFDVSGEGPKKRYFSDELVGALRRARASIDGADRVLIDWVIHSLDAGTYDI